MFLTQVLLRTWYDRITHADGFYIGPRWFIGGGLFRRADINAHVMIFPADIRIGTLTPLNYLQDGAEQMRPEALAYSNVVRTHDRAAHAWTGEEHLVPFANRENVSCLKSGPLACRTLLNRYPD